MCCFSQPVDRVSDTSIFARGMNGRQVLVYSMAYAARNDLAMVLPLPVPPCPREDAVRFLNLEEYPTFFVDMRRAFADRHTMRMPFGGETFELSDTGLEVHEVGDFEASFVPTLGDFERLDPRFCIPQTV